MPTRVLIRGKMEAEIGRRAIMRCAVLGFLGLLATVAGASDQASAPRAESQAPPSATSHGADFVVAIWYRRDQPLDTFKYQVYDLRKGQYSKAVDDWLALMRAKYTTYVVIVRTVNLDDELGQTESLKVGSVIKRELLAAAALQGVFLGKEGSAGLPRSFLPWPGVQPAPVPTLRPSPVRAGLPGAGVRNLNPPGPSFPVPMPYPRPHP
jgi:hypothetical protein